MIFKSDFFRFFGSVEILSLFILLKTDYEGDPSLPQRGRQPKRASEQFSNDFY
jgi:hypothetical protein